MSRKLKPGLDFILIIIALLAAFLNFYNCWNNLYSNSYYTAAVTSMLQSFHNFFFASFDPGGYISIDKPPVVFWVQTLFAYLFGVHGWSLILPQALAGLGSVLLLYKLVRPTFGLAAARWSSLIMVCTPIAVAVSRTNNIDSILVFTLLIAVWMLFKGVRRQQAAWVIGAFAVIGLAFNEKMLQAYMVVPAFYLLSCLAFHWDWKKKLGILTASTGVLLLVSFSWAVLVDAIPADSRPYVGGSQSNSVVELAWGYNGVQRLTGMNHGGPAAGNKNGTAPAPRVQQNDQGGKPGMPPGAIPGGTSDGNRPDDPAFDGYRSRINQPPGGFAVKNDGRNDDQRFNISRLDSGPSQRPGNGGGMFGTGQAGPWRLLQNELSGQASWLIPWVVFACISLLAGLRPKKALTHKERESIFWLSWLLPAAAFFSVAGFFHHYYLIMLAPPIAVLAGAGWTEMYKDYRQKADFRKYLLPLALLLTAAFEIYILQPYAHILGIGCLYGLGAAGIILALLLILTRNKPRIAFCSAVAALLLLLAAPFYWSATPLLYGDNSSLPQAGPSENGPGRTVGQGKQRSGVNTDLIAYLEKNNTGEKYLFATSDANSAAPYIIETGRAVMAMGGFGGKDPALTVAKLKQMVENGEVKYFMISGGGDSRSGGGNSDVTAWIRANSTEVNRDLWQGASSGPAIMGQGEGRTLYLINQAGL